MFCRSLFLLLAIVLSVLLRYTNSDYLHLVSSNSSYSLNVAIEFNFGDEREPCWESNVVSVIIPFTWTILSFLTPFWWLILYFIWTGHGCPPVVLQTEILPYLSLINVTLHNPGKILFNWSYFWGWEWSIM